jgi:hypothetical protein
MRREYGIVSFYWHLGLIGCKLTKKLREIDNFKHKNDYKKIWMHQKIAWVRFSGHNISNYSLILHTADSGKIRVFNNF